MAVQRWAHDPGHLQIIDQALKEDARFVGGSGDMDRRRAGLRLYVRSSGVEAPVHSALPADLAYEVHPNRKRNSPMSAQ